MRRNDELLLYAKGSGNMSFFIPYCKNISEKKYLHLNVYEPFCRLFHIEIFVWVFKYFTLKSYIYSYIESTK